MKESGRFYSDTIYSLDCLCPGVVFRSSIITLQRPELVSLTLTLLSQRSQDGEDRQVQCGASLPEAKSSYRVSSLDTSSWPQRQC